MRGMESRLALATGRVHGLPGLHKTPSVPSFLYLPRLVPTQSPSKTLGP